MSIYASKTAVSSEKSRYEIERILQRYGATGFMYGWTGNSAAIMFQMRGKTVKFVLPLPDKNSKEFTMTPRGRRKRSDQDALRQWNQSCRQAWRALALVVKAKLEAVESGITIFEKEFLAQFVLPNGETFGDYALPIMDTALKQGKMPLLIGNSSGNEIDCG